jgi:hypothetical protein
MSLVLKLQNLFHKWFPHCILLLITEFGHYAKDSLTTSFKDEKIKI